MKLSSGDYKLDVLMDGGFNSNENILIMSPPGEIKKVFGLQFIKKGLDVGQTGIIIDYDSPVKEINEFFDSKKPIIIDGYTWTLGITSTSRYNVQGPNALNDLSILLSHLLERIPSTKRVLFNSLSTLLLYNDPDTVYKFIQIIGARLKNSNATSMFLIESGMHSNEIIATIEHIMDDEITFFHEDKSWKMRIKSLDNFPITVEFSPKKIMIP
ncbi:hypothetical protein J7J26_00115 [Candidatus Micrarchaeota archaeon]|nr:hypothetical protein [Candidatus Micrarchaeota archaeon]